MHRTNWLNRKLENQLEEFSKKGSMEKNLGESGTGYNK